MSCMILLRIINMLRIIYLRIIYHVCNIILSFFFLCVRTVQNNINYLLVNARNVNDVPFSCY
jgi:hypothetical protein